MTYLRTQKTVTDHMLVMVGASTSVFAIGQSIGKPILAWTLAIMVVVATMIGFGLSQLLEKTKAINWDAGLFALLGLASFFLIGPLNRLLPEEGFPWQILAGGMLSWMIILCSMVAWRDRTLLFVSLPCIALFGLVGTFDNFSAGTWMFFAFLVSSGVLYARVHLRSMVARAALAGEPNPELLLRGPWKWMAGPEWAFISGFCIILLSLVGAPVIRESVQTVTNNVRVNLPQPPTPRNNRQSASQTPSEAPIGRGPNNPSDTPVFEVAMDLPQDGSFRGADPTTLRGAEYALYTGSGWSAAQLRLLEDDPLLLDVTSKSGKTNTGPNKGIRGWENGLPPGEPIRDPVSVAISIRAKAILSPRLLAPGPVTEVLAGKKDLTFYGNGHVVLDDNLAPGEELKYFAAIPKNEPTPDSTNNLSENQREIYLNTSRVSPRVLRFAQEASGSAQSPIEKATALQKAITQQVKYNLNASATPPNTDPVEYFLFESKEGYCDLFASSMVLGARSIGLPARYATGWLLDPMSRTDFGFLVREKSYHAWAEIYFEGYGWVPFDATDGAEEVPGGGVGSNRNPMVGFWEREWFLPTVAVLLSASLGFPVILLIVRRTAAFFNPENRRRSELLQAHNSFHLSIEKVTKAPKRFSQTLREYVELSSPTLGDLKPEAIAITERFEQFMFSPHTPNSDQVKAVHQEVSAFRHKLNEHVKGQSERARTRPAA